MSVICMRDLNSLVCACTAKNLTGFQIFGDGERKIRQRTNGDIFQHPRAVRAAYFFQFMNESGGNLEADFVGDDGDFFRRQHAQADAHGIARPRSQLGIKSQLVELPVGWIF
jgi:hypothetical protein